MRLKHVKERMEELEELKNQYDTKISDIKDYINVDLAKTFGSLQLNKFFAKCTKISPGKPIVEFTNVEFSEPPEIFVVANKFIIEYG